MSQNLQHRIAQLSSDLAENLRKPDHLMVQEAQRVLDGAIWDAMDVCLTGDEAGFFLLVAMGAVRAESMTAAIRERTANTQVMVSTPAILEQRMAANGAQFKEMMAACRRVIVWLAPEDTRDNALKHWIGVWAAMTSEIQLCVAYLCPWKPEKSVLEMLENTHETFMFLGSRDEEKIQICIDYLDASSDSWNFSEDFTKCIYPGNTLVICRNDEFKLKYAEASHIRHVPVGYAGRAVNTRQSGSYQYMVKDAVSCLPESVHPSQVVAIDPNIFNHRLKSLLSGCAEDNHICILATSRSSLLYSFAGLCHEMPVMTPSAWDLWCMDLYGIFAELSRGMNLESASIERHLGENSRQILEYWLAQEWISGQQNYKLTDKGQRLFPETAHFSQLGMLNAYHHETMAETIGRDLQILLDTDLMRLPGTQFFVCGTKVWQTQFHQLLRSKAVIRPKTDSVDNIWLERHLGIISRPEMRVIEEIIKKREIPADICMTTTAQRIFNDISESLAHVCSSKCIEIGCGEAVWWTFAGAKMNLWLVHLLHILAPKLKVSFGNFCLLLRWHRSKNEIQPEIQRLTMLVDQIGRIHEAAFEKYLPALYELWKKAQPYQWLFRLMPDNIIHLQFESELSGFSDWFAENTHPVRSVEQIHLPDDLPVVFEDAISGSSQQSPANDSRLGRNNTKHSNEVLEKTSSSHSTPVIDGIMHTRMKWSYIDNPVSFNRAMDVILKQPYIGLDVETTLFDQSLCLIQIGCADQTFIIDPLCVDFSGLAHVFSHPDIIKIIHNASFECKVLGKCGMQIHPIVDTMKVSRKKYGMKAPGGHSLKAVCMREFGLDMDKTHQTSRWEKRPLSDGQLEYAALDAEILIHLYRKFFEHDN